MGSIDAPPNEGTDSGTPKQRVRAASPNLTPALAYTPSTPTPNASFKRKHPSLSSIPFDITDPEASTSARLDNWHAPRTSIYYIYLTISIVAYTFINGETR